jgi:hypothetical protein
VTDYQIIAHLAAGAALRLDRDATSYQLVTFRAEVSAAQVEQLNRAGWLHGFPNGCGAWLSDAGRAQYIKSTDEMGDGKLVSPVEGAAHV